MRNVVKFTVIIPLLFTGFMCFYLGLYIGTVIIAAICLIINFLTMDKEKLNRKKEKAHNTLKDLKEKTNTGIEIAGEYMKYAADTTGRLGVKAARAAGSGVKSAYKEMGGHEGAKKAVNELGKAAGEAGKIFVDAGIAAGNAISDTAKYAGKQIEANRKKREQIERTKEPKQLEDVIVSFINNIE